MPIRVEYGPSAVAVGELAFRTGQNEYIAKRRKELEELAQRQAEMRQRSQLQQQSLQSDLYKFHGQQQTAMKQLEQRRQQVEQQGVQFQQGQQQQMQLAEQGREHDLQLKKLHGEQEVADARMRHGLATQRDWNTAKRNQYIDTYKTKLNDNGRMKMMELLKQAEDVGNDTRISPDEQRRSQQEIYGQIEVLEDDTQYRIDADQVVGYEEGFGAISGGFETNTSHKRVRNAQGGWDVVTNYDYTTQDAFTGEMVTNTVTQEEWEKHHLPPSYENEAGEIKAPDKFNEVTGQWDYRTVSTREQRDALQQKKKAEEAAERKELYGMYQADRDSASNTGAAFLNSDDDPMTFNDWLTEVYQLPGGGPPAPAPQPPEPAPQPPQPAPQPPQPAPQPVEQAPPEVPVEPDQPAGPVTDPAAPIGTEGNPIIVNSQAEADDMRDRGEIGEDDVVWSQGDPAPQPAPQPQLPQSVIQQREARGDREAREARMIAREDAAMAEQAEAQRLDAIDEAKRVQYRRERTPMSPEEQIRREDAAIREEMEAQRIDRKVAERSGIPLYFDPSIRGVGGRPGRETPMSSAADEPQIQRYDVERDRLGYQYNPVYSLPREYMAELERRDAEMKDRVQSIDYQPSQEVASQYGINQNFQTYFGEQQPATTTLGVLEGQPHQYPTDNYKVPVYPGAAEADQNSVEGIELQMKYNTSAWQRDPNREVERVSSEELMEQTRRKLNPQPKWQGPLQGF